VGQEGKKKEKVVLDFWGSTYRMGKDIFVVIT
jgi:hypothetical protein